MPIRRAADPICVQHVWDAIRHTIVQRQMPDTKKIMKYLQRVDKCSISQAELYIQQALHDGLIQSTSKAIKGENTESFKMPTQDLPELDGKDWYCFECHLAGDVQSCQNCYRVFHADCINNGRRKYEEYKTTSMPKKPTESSNGPSLDSTNISSCSDADGSSILNESGGSSTYKMNNNEAANTSRICSDTYDVDLCSICNISKMAADCDLEKSELNYMLKFVTHRIQNWLPNTITHTMAPEERLEWLTDKELTWRANQLFFEHRDMSVIEVNLNSEAYCQVYEFLADVLTIQHNVAIFHGIESQEYEASELMVKDCIHDLAEMKICVDCYRHSNEKINSKWYCLPCRVPHALVWAKQKGYPHWPAKILRETKTHFDVRFFGGKYERSLLAKSFIKPIQTPKEKLQVYSSASGMHTIKTFQYLKNQPTDNLNWTSCCRYGKEMNSKFQIKTSTQFNKAVEELKFHQKLLANPLELGRLIESSKKLKPKASMTPKKFSAPLKSSQTSSNPRKSSLDSIDGASRFNDSSFESQPSLNSAEQGTGKLKRKSENCEGSAVVKKRALSGEEPVQSVSSDSKHDSSVIDISDGDDETEFSFRQNYPPPPPVNNFDYNAYDQVSSSTENFKVHEPVVHHPLQDNGMQQLDHPYSDSVEKMRRKMECMTDKKDIIKCAMDCMQGEIDRITNDHNDHLKRLFESHHAQISETKKKQWCYNCEQDAIYHCCWNTAYCSQSCQQQHWQAEHKKVCRRKR